MSNILRDVIQQNRAGKTIALPSVCSAHPDVLAASLLLAKELQRPLIVEATSNQVNQDGGYTGMRPDDFVKFVGEIARECQFDTDQIIFGGDHLGPQVWRKLPAEQAMAKAEVLVADYVSAGFGKIHLDCSEGCAGEPAQVDDDTSAARAARLAAICEQATDQPETLSYMVGTEVPPPGGARADDEHGDTIPPTRPENAEITLQKHFDAFDAAGISDAKRRIAALVVQPGVEFSATDVFHLPSSATHELRDMIQRYDGVCFEAHSTDYQHAAAYPRMAQMGFAIHKVGPALTFAYRQAAYGLNSLLDIVQRQGRTCPQLNDVMESLMLQNPENWTSHYQGDANTLRLLRHYSYADRIRYYWNQPEAQDAVVQLLGEVDAADIPAPVWSQFFSAPTRERAGQLQKQGINVGRSHILAEIQVALLPYFFNDETKG